MSSKKKILVIPDTQVKAGIDLTYLTAIGNYIVKCKPDHIVCLGDFADLPSLSSYDRGKKSFEGRRLIDDINAAHEGMKAMLKPLHKYQEKTLKNHQKRYNPSLTLTMGNHEDRLDRFVNDHPELDGVLGLGMLGYELFGWNVIPFLQPIEIEGINFLHYIPNRLSGRPRGGNALSILKETGKSYVVGHTQTLDIATRYLLNGKMQIGIVAGACYPHDEDYKGWVGNQHFRGLIVLHEVDNGSALPMPVSLKYIMSNYA